MPSALRLAIVSLIAAFLVASCGVFPETVSVQDPRVQSLLKAATAFDRAAYGFSPLPVSGDVDFESRPRSGYDAMLDLGGKTSRR